MDDFWDVIRPHIQTDDGPYPEICVLGLNGSEVEKIFSEIMEEKPWVVGTPYLFDLRDGMEKEVSSVENPARLVTEGNAKPFYFLVQRFSTPHGEIPEMGIFLLPNAICIDFQKGPTWEKPQVSALFFFILYLCSQSVNTRIQLEEGGDSEFLQALSTSLSLFQQMIASAG